MTNIWIIPNNIRADDEPSNALSGALLGVKELTVCTVVRGYHIRKDSWTLTTTRGCQERAEKHARHALLCRETEATYLDTFQGNFHDQRYERLSAETKYIRTHFWGAEGVPILFSDLGYRMASCS